MGFRGSLAERGLEMVYFLRHRGKVFFLTNSIFLILWTDDIMFFNSGISQELRCFFMKLLSFWL